MNLNIPTNLKEILDLLNAFLTPTIAIVTVSILYLQHKLASQRWRLNLYDKRYPVYLSTMAFISQIVRNGGVSSFDDVIKFARESRDKDFLFGDDVQQFLKEIEEKAMLLYTIRKKYEALLVEDSEATLRPKGRSFSSVACCRFAPLYTA